MPAALRAFREQEVDRRERRAPAAAVAGLDREVAAPDLAVVAALGMRLELERADQLLDARGVHRAVPLGGVRIGAEPLAHRRRSDPAFPVFERDRVDRVLA